MDNVNLPPTNNRPVLLVALRARAVQELHELQVILAFVDSRLENIEQFLNNFANQPNETNMNNFESDDESVDTPLVSHFPHSDNDSNDGEVLNELSEYENAGVLRQERIIISFDGRKAYLLEDKQILSVGVFDEVFSTWMTFGGNTRDLGSFGEETDEITDLHQDSRRSIILRAWRRHHRHKATPS
ncbi:hypothetical protein Tco_0927012 [Tanacetum coccineum]|uniref:Uncharacterized protein n=1 Tax=Tanacetum coccineum TaxID=301880 RepID=A0ABQ5DCA6_9ASTR